VGDEFMSLRIFSCYPLCTTGVDYETFPVETVVSGTAFFSVVDTTLSQDKGF
jgi:hypothetical protein